MTKLKNKLYQGVLFFGDVFLFVVSVYLTYILRNQETYAPFVYIVWLFSPVLVFLVVAYFIATLYEVPPLTTTIARVKLITQLHVAALVFGITIFYIFPMDGFTPKVTLALQMGIYTILQIVWRVYSSHYIRTKKKTRALLIGEGADYAELKKAINENPHSSVVFVDHVEVSSSLLTTGTLDALKTVLVENGITLVVVDIKSEGVVPLLPYFYNLVGDGVRIYDINKMYEDVFRRMSLSSVGYFWFFEHVTIDMRIYEIAKRATDIVIALFVGAFWLLLHPFVSLLIKYEDGGSIFLQNQLRMGRHGKTIRLIKYRTMTSDETGVWLKEKGNQNRVTKVGYYLRKSRIDELPQVINVLRGDISLIGPRPDIVDLGRRMEKEIPYYMIRYSVQPGLSGWAQTLQEKPPQSVDETKIRLMYDLFYIKNRSYLVDIIVLLRTVRTLFMRSGM